MAERILQIEPDEARALAIDVFIKRSEAGRGNKAASASLGPEAERGIRSVARWQKPSGMGNAEFKNLRLQMTSIFQGAAGFAALQAKDYGTARAHYRKAIRVSPNNLQDVYQLGVTELQMKPLDSAGFWHIARALKLASGNTAAQKNDTSLRQGHVRSLPRQRRGLACDRGRSGKARGATAWIFGQASALKRHI